MATKKCPFCAEEIQEEAILCKYCKSDLKVLILNSNDDSVNKETQDFDNNNKNSTIENNYNSRNNNNFVGRKTELLFGLFGGIMGIASSLLLIYRSSFFDVINLSVSFEISEIYSLIIVALISSILGIVGALITMNNGKLGSLMMFLAAISGFFSLREYYTVAGIFLCIGGIMGIRKPNQPNKSIRGYIYPIVVMVVFMTTIFLDAVVYLNKPENSFAFNSILPSCNFKFECYLVNDVTFRIKNEDSFNWYETEIKLNDKYIYNLEGQLESLNGIKIGLGAFVDKSTGERYNPFTTKVLKTEISFTSNGKAYRRTFKGSSRANWH